jgi:hypothetical protein
VPLSPKSCLIVAAPVKYILPSSIIVEKLASHVYHTHIDKKFPIKRSISGSRSVSLHGTAENYFALTLWTQTGTAGIAYFTPEIITQAKQGNRLYAPSRHCCLGMVTTGMQTILLEVRVTAATAMSAYQCASCSRRGVLCAMALISSSRVARERGHA